MNFKPGELVKIKSGGPQMTIVKIDSEQKSAHCIWFDGPKPCGHSFSVVALEYG